MRVTAALLATLLLGTAAIAAPKPEAVLRKEIGNEYLKKRDYAKARDEYLSALKIDPAFEDAHYNLGIVYFFRLQDYPRALYHLTTYARIVKDAPDMGQVKSLVFQALEKIEEGDRDAYARALAEGKVAALRDYIERRPNSLYVADAKDKIRQFEVYEAEVRVFWAAADGAYTRALAQGTPEALDEYLAKYPDSPKAEEARQLRTQWIDDEKAYRAALAVGTMEALERFAAEHPQSAFAPQLRTRLERWKAAEEAFRTASASRSLSSVREFLKNYEDSPRQPEAMRLLDSLEREEAEAKAEEQARTRAAEEQEKAADAQRRASEAKPATPALPPAQEATPAPAPDETPPATETPKESVPPVPAETLTPAEAKAPAAPTETPTPAATPVAPAAEEPKAPAPPPAVSPPSPPSPSPGETKTAPSAVPSEAAKPEPQTSLTPEQQLHADWKNARDTDSKEAYEGFLRLHPDGEETEAARSRLAELSSAGDAAAIDREKKKTLDKYRKRIQEK